MENGPLHNMEAAPSSMEAAPSKYGSKYNGSSPLHNGRSMEAAPSAPSRKQSGKAVPSRNMEKQSPPGK